MDSKLKIGFIGYTDMVREYLRAFEKIDEISFEGAYWDTAEVAPEEYDGHIFDSPADLYKAVDAVIFLGEKVRKKLIADAIRSLKHVFIDDYSAVLNSDIEGLYKLAKEAEVTTLVSMPKMHYWNIDDIISSTKNLRSIIFSKEQTHFNSRLQADYIPELAAILKIVDNEALRVHCQKTPLLSKKIELVDIRLEFANGVTANVNVNPCGFYDVQELRIISEKALLMFDLRKREVHALVRNSKKEIEKEVTNMEEVPFVEVDELSDFIESINAKKEPTISFGDIKRLQHCLQMMEEQ